MLAADTILPSDTSALYDSVANRDCVKLVHSFAKAVRHAFSAVSNRKNIPDGMRIDLSSTLINNKLRIMHFAH